MAVSSGQVVRQAQIARDDGAVVQNPQMSVQQFLGAPPEPALMDFGTNGRLRPLTSTQATPPSPISAALPITTPALAQAAAQAAIKAPTQIGVGAPPEDAARTNTTATNANATQSAVDQLFADSALTAQPNVLDQYASYTYSISFYMITGEDYGRLVEAKSLNVIPTDRLLFQSGGITSRANKRNPYFQLDYFIESLSIKSVMAQNSATNAASNTTMEMTVMETNGITLLQNLQRASEKMNRTSAAAGASAAQQGVDQPYLIVIKFYGYDSAGNLVRGGQPYGGATDQYALVEKFFTVKVTNIKFKVQNKLVEYEFKMTCQAVQAMAKLRTSTPYKYEVAASTVKEALLGPVNNNTAPAGDGRTSTKNPGSGATKPPPASADAKNSQFIRQGILQAMNENQQKLVKDKQQAVADTFTIEFTDDAIASAKITVKDGEKRGTGTPAPTPQQQNPDKQSVSNTTRQIGFESGTPMVQLIEQVIRNSSYITDQSNTQVSEKDGTFVPNPSSGKNFAWFKINLQAVQGKWDKIRNDYAYNYKYVISPYKVNQVVSQYFANPADKNSATQGKAVHKRYDYWFTGKNTQVISFDMEFNNLYTVLFSGSLQNSLQQSVGTYGKAAFSPSPSESAQGAAGKTNAIGASAADYLYDPQAVQNITVGIIGDPAWITQGEDAVLNVNDLKTGAPFLPDGTINSSVSQVLFEVFYGTPQDYNINTGLMDPSSRPMLYPTGSDKPGAAAQSIIAQATDISHEFNRGKFTQTLKGKMVQYFPDQTVKDAQRAGVPPLGTASRTSDQAAANAPVANNSGTETSGSTKANPNPTPRPAPTPRPPTSSGQITTPANNLILNNAVGAVSSGRTGFPTSETNRLILSNALGSQIINREA